MALNHHERAAAEQRIDDIKHEIKAILDDHARTEPLISRWQELLEESLALQRALEQD